MKRLLLFSLLLIILIIITSIAFLGASESLDNSQKVLSSSILSQEAAGPAWHVLDIITPTLNSIEWIEVGNYSEPPSWISDGRWYEAHSRKTLVKPDDIFTSFSEILNWTAVNMGFSHPYSSFDEFKEEISKDPSWWLEYSWSVDVGWHGVSLNRTKVVTKFDAETAIAEVYIWCHVTNIPEYILGEKRFETMLTGFDLTSVSVGSLESLRWYEDYTPAGRYYYIYFKAPANLMSLYRDTYSLILEVSPLYKNSTYNVEQTIQIIMPSNTEVKSASPPSMATFGKNAATFTIHRGDRYPALFSITSGSPLKDVTQSFLESASRWLTEPSIWVAFGALAGLFYTAFRGTRAWQRRKTYYRLYRSMVNIFDHYSKDLPRFYQELDNLSITQYFVEDKLTDEQFDKLLTRRDDLIERVKRLQPAEP